MTQSATSNGLQITPLTLWVAAGLGSVLWGVLFWQGTRAREQQDEMQKAVTTLVTSHAYDRTEIDGIKGDVKAVSERVSVLERRK
jgi:hypothetical protein